jgi:hypothetical protein
MAQTTSLLEQLSTPHGILQHFKSVYQKYGKRHIVHNACNEMYIVRIEWPSNTFLKLAICPTCFHDKVKPDLCSIPAYWLAGPGTVSVQIQHSHSRVSNNCQVCDKIIVNDYCIITDERTNNHEFMEYKRIEYPFSQQNNSSNNTQWIRKRQPLHFILDQIM